MSASVERCPHCNAPGVTYDRNHACPMHLVPPDDPRQELKRQLDAIGTEIVDAIMASWIGRALIRFDRWLERRHR